ncbi:MAG: serine hydroxymethyltransferase [Candidatus Hodarchaeales archaeon]|jgi:glycine hydroxymethyltransferase
MEPIETFQNIRSLLKEHHENWDRCIPLIASENVTSLAVREAELSDFQHRYAEGWVGERVYAGCAFIDKVEDICLNLLKNLYNVPFVDVRPISGVVANLTIYTAFASAGDLMMAISIPVGGHISFGPLKAKSGAVIGGTAGAVSRLEVDYIPFDRHGLNIDVDKAEKAIREKKPKLIQFGASVFLFPHPVKELVPVAKEVDAHVNYDAAHVAGLIAGKCFQDPIQEGADTVTFSTHKTFFGPQHGCVLAAREELADVIKLAAFPGVTSNHHLHTLAALAVSTAELQEFGQDYSKQVIKNAKALGQCLYERGFEVVCPEKGFTESHTLLIDIVKLADSVGLGGDIERLLESANIIINRNLLPWDILEGRHYTNPGGIRLGTSEITRIGMKESEMDHIAELIKRVLLDRQDPVSVKKEVAEFRQDFRELHYCFETGAKAYEYISII